LKNPIAIIPNGIDLREHGNKLRAVQCPLHVGWIPDCCWHKVLLYLGRIHPKKGLVPVLRAWKEAHRSKDWVFVIAGWDQGGHEAELKNLCTELLIPWRDVRDSELNSASAEWPLAEVVFLGPRFGDAKAACYQSCDAFILPSLSEGLPMAVLEAWAYSKPVLMTPQCNLPAGFAADAAIRIEANPQSIAFGLSCLFNSRSSSLLAMGQRGRNLASSRFAWGHIAKEMKEVYEWMLGGGVKPASVFEG
jgi:poly(glycerol-phosphate) alpha-glucosyltransferase